MSKGAKSIILATLLFSEMNVFVKLLKDIPTAEIVLFRSIFTLVACFIVLKRQGIPLMGSGSKFLWLRGVFGSASLIFFFKSVQTLTLATATLVHYITPFFTTFFGYYFLKEKFYKIQWLFLIICFIGIAISQGVDLTGGQLFAFQNQGIYFGLGATVMAAAAYNCIRKISVSENPNVILFYFPLVSIPVSLIVMLLSGGFVMPTLLQFFQLMCMGALTQGAQYFMTTAYQNEKVGVIAIYSNMGILYAILNGIIFFKEIPDHKVIIGIIIVITGIVLNIFSEKILRFFAGPKTISEG